MAPRLSLAMIVRNESTRLGACLDSVQGLVDEMVILDTGSNDGTPELAAARGARVFRVPWTDDFSAARNEGLRRCSGDWILILDADERLDAAGAARIRQVMDQPAPEGHLLTVRNYLPSGAYTGIHGSAQPHPGDYPDAQGLCYMTTFPALRLVRRHERLAFTGRIHESLEPAFDALGWHARPLEALIHHLGKAEPSREQAKQTAYFRMAQAEAADHPDDLRAQYNLLQEAAMVEAWEACAEAARSYLRLQPRAPLKVFLDGARALRELGHLEEAEALLARATPAGASLPAWRSEQGALLLAQGRQDAAVATLLEAIAEDPGFTKPFLQLADYLRDAGDPAQAHALLQAGLDQNPQDLLLWQALVGLAAATGDLAAAGREAWNALAAFPRGGQGLWHQLAALALAEKGCGTDARTVLLRGLTAFPDHAELRALLDTLDTAP